MNEAVHAGQSERLARGVRRWRLATFVLAILFVGSFVLAAAFGYSLTVQMQEWDGLQKVLLQEQGGRRKAEAAQQRLEKELEAVRKKGENAP